MKALTTAGNPLYLSITVLVGGAILGWLTRSWRPLLVLALVMLGAVSLDHLIKLAVARTRPALLYWAVSATGFVFPFRSRLGVRGSLPDSRTYVCRHGDEVGREDLDLCDRNRSAAADWYVAGVFRSSLADGCHERLGARRNVVGDRARLELCGPVDRLTS
jgi:hypothetical protein